jgi:predicted DNA-binding protein
MSSRHRVVQDALSRDLSSELDEGAMVDAEPVPEATDADLEVLVGRSVRLPLRADEALKRAARERGTTPSALIRQWIEAGLAELDDDRVVSLAEARRALAMASVTKPRRTVA